MYFIDGLVALAQRLGCSPDDICFLSIPIIIFCWEFIGWLLVLLYRFLRWGFRQLRSLYDKRAGGLTAPALVRTLAILVPPPTSSSN